MQAPGTFKGRSCEGRLCFCPPPGPTSCGYCKRRAGRPGLGAKRKRPAPHFPAALGERPPLSCIPVPGAQCSIQHLDRFPPPSSQSLPLSPRTPRPCAPADVLSRQPFAPRPGATAARGSRGARSGYAPSAWDRGSARYSGSSWCPSSSRPWARWACTWRNGRWPGRDPRPGGGRSRTSVGAGSQTRSCPGY